MKLLIIDQDDVGLALAFRAVQHGHQVKLFHDPKHRDHKTGHGFKGIEHVDNFVAHAAWADVIFPVSNGKYMERLAAMKKQGAPVFGPSVESTDLEVRRAVGMRFLEEHGIDVPPYKTFANLKEAERHVWRTEERYVFKTLGDNEDKSLSYCSKSPADMISRLQRWQKLGMNPKGPVMLQEFIEGIEFGVSAWFGKDGRIGCWNECFEHKPLMPSGTGPNTGEMGTVMQYVAESQLGKIVFDPIHDDLVKLGHLGDVDLNCIIDKKGKPWPLEFTSRPGWPAFNIMLAEHKGDPVAWMVDALQGKDSMDCSLDVAIGIVVAHPDFPYDKRPPEETGGIPVYGLDKGNLRYVQPQGVRIESRPDMEGDKVVEKDGWVTSGTYVAVVTGLGSSVRQASERAYKVVKEIQVANKIYRDDIGEGLKKQLPELHKHGFATQMRYE